MIAGFTDKKPPSGKTFDLSKADFSKQETYGSSVQKAKLGTHVCEDGVEDTLFVAYHSFVKEAETSKITVILWYGLEQHKRYASSANPDDYHILDAVFGGRETWEEFLHQLLLQEEEEYMSKLEAEFEAEMRAEYYRTCC